MRNPLLRGGVVNWLYKWLESAILRLALQPH
nr:MAG TPA: hypothetical protein [Caudoviricetes sp.]